MYAPPGMWAWDFWLVEHGDELHLFHLQAPRALHPELRHQRATVGHAVSRDLVRWRYEGTALAPGPPGSWDDLCIWTGSILPHRGRWYFLYTGRRRGELLVQRIGLAVSDDLHRFEKHPANPVLQADPRWYQTAAEWGVGVEDWRDPWLCRLDGRVHAFVTARLRPPSGTGRAALRGAHLREALAMAAPGPLRPWLLPRGPLAGRGCLALARAEDEALTRWTVEPPVLAPGRYGMLECPQHLEEDGRHYLLFSTWAGCHAAGSGRAETGLHAWVAGGPRGPYRPVNGDGVVLGSASRCYATRLLRPPGSDAWWAWSWLRSSPRGSGFCGRIAGPQAVRLAGDQVEVAPVFPGDEARGPRSS